MNKKMSSIISCKRWEDIKAHFHLVDNTTLDSNRYTSKSKTVSRRFTKRISKYSDGEALMCGWANGLLQRSLLIDTVPPNEAKIMWLQNICSCRQHWNGIWFHPVHRKNYSYRSSRYSQDRPFRSQFKFCSSLSRLHSQREKPQNIFWNWFTFLKFIVHLATRQIRACETVQQRWLQGLFFTDDKNLAKLGRSAFDEQETIVEDTKITFLKW